MLADPDRTAFKNPLNVKKSASIAHVKKVARSPPPLKLDFPEVYTQINAVLALSFGLVVDG